jgi:hypothetical protein
MIYEEPSKYGIPVPVVERRFVEEKEQWLLGLYTFSEPDQKFSLRVEAQKGHLLLSKRGTEATQFFQEIINPAPRWAEILLDLSKSVHADFLARNGTVDVLVFYLNNEDFSKLSLSDTEASDFRITFHLAYLWPAWESQRLSWAARAYDLQSKAGITFNPNDAIKNAKNLQMRCRRLQLEKGNEF